MSDRTSQWRTLGILALLATLAYAPLWGIPLLEDDYPNLWQSLQWGAPAQAAELLGNAVFRLRATSFWLMFELWPVGKVSPFVYHLASLLAHIANTWLLYGICRAWPRMRSAAFWAAAFFAIQEGHQEAVMWFSAINELLLFLFGAGAVWCWLKRDRGWGWQVAGGTSFGLAILSKESAVVILPLLVLVSGRTEWRKSAVRLAPYGLLAALALASIVQSRSASFRFSDGSFDLHAPFWLTWSRNYFRVLWIWGVPAIAAILAARDRELRRSGGLAALWLGIGLLPYSFLLYSSQIPSRQTYLASAGLAILVGLAIAWWWENLPRRRQILTALLLLILLHNVGYLLTRKRRQFLERAAPTEALIQLARRTQAPIFMRCFPRNHFIAEEAAHLGAGRSPADLVWTQEEARRREAVDFCWVEQH